MSGVLIACVTVVRVGHHEFILNKNIKPGGWQSLCNGLFLVLLLWAWYGHNKMFSYLVYGDQIWTDKLLFLVWVGSFPIWASLPVPPHKLALTFQKYSAVC